MTGAAGRSDPRPGASPGSGPGALPPPGRRTGLRVRLAVVYGALVTGGALLLLFLSYLVVRRALASAFVYTPDTLVPVLDTEGRRVGFLTAAQVQERLTEFALGRLLREGALILVIVAVVAVVVAYLLAASLLRPLQQVTAAARALAQDPRPQPGLDARIRLGGPDDELRELADTFDAMLARLDATFAAQRAFVANASHELRTPLAVMRTEVDVTLADPDAPTAELRAMGQVVRDATERADRLVDSLLLLARVDALRERVLAAAEPVDLVAAARGALAAVADEVAVRRIGVQIGDDPAVATGNRALLERLVGNLMENAVRHNIDDGMVAVRAVTSVDRVRLQVANTGPRVAPEEVAGLFEPFRRLGRPRVGSRGAGLGLSIVRSIATAHGGTVQALAPAAGGLEVTVTLPTAAAAPSAAEVTSSPAARTV